MRSRLAHDEGRCQPMTCPVCEREAEQDKGREAEMARTGRCQNGHDLNAPAAWLESGGQRACRKCARAAERARRDAQRRARGAAIKTPAGECKRGHDLSLPDAWTGGRRPRCRLCQKARNDAAGHLRKTTAPRPKETST